jgi:hypothetical protein
VRPNPHQDGLTVFEPDWQQVLRRAEKLRHRHRRRHLAVVAVALSVAAITLPALAGSGLFSSILGGSPVPKGQLSALDVHGLAALATRRSIPLDSLALSTERRRALASFGLEGVRLLSARDGIKFYVLDRTDGRHCYALGPDRPGDLFGTVSCGGPADKFPSSEQPIFDLSITGANSPSEPMHVIQLRGIAANGVATVGVLGLDGQVYGKTTVTDNVFVSSDLPTNATGAVIAYDSSGKAIWCGRTPDEVCPSSAQP